MSIKLKLDGFDDMLKQIEKAGGSVKGATLTCMQKSGQIMDAELRAKMAAANVDPSLISRMPAPSIEDDFGLITASVGYKKGSYNPQNLSDGYKVVFVNYGTPYRTKHGKIQGKTVKMGFIRRAKSGAKRKIKKMQEQTLHDILKGL